MKIIVENPSISKLRSITYGCEDFFDSVELLGLQSNLERYFDETFPDGISVDHFVDIIRYEDSFLETIKNF